MLTFELLAGRPPWYDAADQANTYKLILGAELALPPGWSPLARDFVGRLLQVGAARAGCMAVWQRVCVARAHAHTPPKLRTS